MLIDGTEDLRVQKTIDAIQKTFEDMICEMDYEKITCSGNYGYIRSRMISNVMNSTWKSSAWLQLL